MRPVTALCTILLLLVTVPTTLAGKPDQEEIDALRGIEDRVSASIGGFLVGYDTRVAISSGNVVGALINAENVLGLDSRQVNGRIDGHYRFGKRSRVDFGYFLLSRSADVVLIEDLPIGEEIIQAGARARTRFETGFVKASYDYSFVKTGIVEFGFSAGLSILDVDFELEGSAFVQLPGDNEKIDGRVETSLVAPVPVVGQFLEWRLRRRLFYRASLEFFRLSTGDIRADLTDVRFTLDWYPSRNVGLGLGYEFFNAVYADKDGGSGFSVNYEFDGPLVYITYSF